MTTRHSTTGNDPQKRELMRLIFSHPQVQQTPTESEVDESLIAAAATGTLTEPERAELLRKLAADPALRVELEFVMQEEEEQAGDANPNSNSSVTVAPNRSLTMVVWLVGSLTTAALILLAVTALLWKPATSPAERLALAQTQLEQKQYAAAIDLLRPILGSPKSSAPDQKRAGEMYQAATITLAGLAHAQNNPAELRHLRDDLEAHDLAAQELYDLHQDAVAKSPDLLLVAEYPGVVHVRNMYVLSAARPPYADATLAKLRQAAEDDSENRVVQLNYGYALLKDESQDPREAEKIFRKFAGPNSRDKEAWVCLGLAQQVLGDYKGALESYSKARELGFQSPELDDNITRATAELPNQNN